LVGKLEVANASRPCPKIRAGHASSTTLDAYECSYVIFYSFVVQWFWNVESDNPVLKPSESSKVKTATYVMSGEIKTLAAIKSERMALNTLASELRKNYEFKCFYGEPTFGDVKAAVGFR
jgi:hypothetical protein